MTMTRGTCVPSIMKIDQPDSYFFCPRDKMNTNSGTSKRSRNKRKAGGGYWKETSKKWDIEDEETREVVGTKRIFPFCSGNQRNAGKTKLDSHEYHLNVAVADETIPDPTAFALCHIKKEKQRKKANPKEQQSKLSDSPSCGADSGGTVTPGMYEGIEAKETNLEGFSLVLGGRQIPIHSEIGSPEGNMCYPQQLQLAEQSPIINKHPSSKHGSAHRIANRLRNSYLQIGLGVEETIPDAAFDGETTMDSQTPSTMMPMFSSPDFTTIGACEDVGNPVSNYAYDDGLSLEDLWNWDYDDGLSLEDLCNWNWSGSIRDGPILAEFACQ